jgi:hypothetical protein
VNESPGESWGFSLPLFYLILFYSDSQPEQPAALSKLVAFPVGHV